MYRTWYLYWYCMISSYLLYRCWRRTTTYLVQVQISACMTGRHSALSTRHSALGIREWMIGVCAVRCLRDSNIQEVFYRKARYLAPLLRISRSKPGYNTPVQVFGDMERIAAFRFSLLGHGLGFLLLPSLFLTHYYYYSTTNST